jgi:GxxExxY protein
VKSELIEEKSTGGIIGAFYEVYNRLGFGFLEHAYALAMERELLARGHTVRREVTVVIHYKGEPLTTHRLDMLVDEKVVVEIKSTAQLPTFSKRQTLNCLRATSLHVGMLLHFGPEAKFYRLVQSHPPAH